MVENGHAIAVVVLVAVLESAINRARYVKGAALDQHVAAYFRSAFDEHGELSDDLDEVFALRDALAHKPPLGGLVSRPRQYLGDRRSAGIEKRIHAHGLRHTHAAELALEGKAMKPD